jgi:hypothetical protein
VRRRDGAGSGSAIAAESGTGITPGFGIHPLNFALALLQDR